MTDRPKPEYKPRNDINICLIEGRLVRDAEYRAYSDDVGWCEFAMANNLRISTDNWHTNFIRCTIFGKRAVKLAKRLTTGTAVVVNGRLKIRTYEHNGVKRVAVEIMVDTIRPLGKFKSDEEMLKGEALKETFERDFEAQAAPDDIPF